MPEAAQQSKNHPISDHMSLPRSRAGRTRRLAGWLFWLSLLGLLGSLCLAGWAYELKQRLGYHLELGLPKQGYLLPGTLGLGVLLVAPCHLLGVALRPAGLLLRSGSPSRGRLLLLHALLSCLSGWLAAGACAGSAYYWHRTRLMLGQGLRRAMSRYRYDEAVKARLDSLQIEMACCGGESFVDWLLVPWVRTREDDEEEKEEEEEDDKYIMRD